MDQQSIPKPANSDPLIELLAKLIVTKLLEDELSIGIAYLNSGQHAIVSLDEYAKHDFNLHLYCSPSLVFFIGIEKENDEGELVEDLFSLADEDLLTIPSGLKDLMGKVAASGKETVFTAKALD